MLTDDGIGSFVIKLQVGATEKIKEASGTTRDDCSFGTVGVVVGVGGVSTWMLVIHHGRSSKSSDDGSPLLIRPDRK